MLDYEYYILKVVEALLLPHAIEMRRATAYVTPEKVIRATRRGRWTPLHCEMIVSITKPNYRERQFIRQCLKVGESFPVQKVQFQFAPKRYGAKYVPPRWVK